MNLSSLGGRQGEALARWLADTPLAAIYASPMARVRQTMAPLLELRGASPVFMEGLREVDFGDWTGHTWGGIQKNFGTKESRFWNSDLTILGFDRVHQTAFRPWAPQTIPRRFCSAMAYTSDGVKRPVHYVIGEDTGMIGASWGVEWCVVGLDRNWAFNPACKMARP